MTSKFKVLVVEDNPGDFNLVEEFLFEKMESPSVIHVMCFREAKEILQVKDNFDAILLDLTLPDKNGEELIIEMLAICRNAPVIVLTGYADFDFSTRSLSWGVSDYMLKEELTALSLYKCIVYSLERKKSIASLEESEKKYSQLFHLSPLPMWVVDVHTLRFLDVNMATINHYGYTEEEFLTMTLRDIRCAEDCALLYQQMAEVKQTQAVVSEFVVVHRKKNGQTRNVELRVVPVTFRGVSANLVIATDVTEQLEYIRAIEEQNAKLREIAWTQSHVVRAPLARLMGLVHILPNVEEDPAEKEMILEYMMLSANELDEIIRDISDKASLVKY